MAVALGGKAARAVRRGVSSGMVVNKDVCRGAHVVFKACVVCCGGSNGGCRGVVGPIENVGPANEMLSFSWPPKNPVDSRRQMW